MAQPLTDQETDNGGSDHRPVLTTPYLPSAKQPSLKPSYIPQKQRANPTILEKAKAMYETELGVSLASAQKASSVAALEKAYDKFQSVLLSPWERSREPRPNRFRTFWSETLNGMARKRRKLYRRAIADGSDIAQSA